MAAANTQGTTSPGFHHIRWPRRASILDEGARTVERGASGEVCSANRLDIRLIGRQAMMRRPPPVGLVTSAATVIDKQKCLRAR